MDDKLLTQRDLAERWLLSQATLERWRTEGIGPMFLKLQGQVRYRLALRMALWSPANRQSFSTKPQTTGTPSMSAACCGATLLSVSSGLFRASPNWLPRMRLARFWPRWMPLPESVRGSV